MLLSTIINLTVISEKISNSYLLENNLWRGVHNLNPFNLPLQSRRSLTAATERNL